MSLDFNPGADRRLLDEGGGARTMRWIMAIMLFLTVLAGALGLGMFGAAAQLDRQMSGRLTIQIVEADPARRDAEVQAVQAAVGRVDGVTRVEAVDRARLAALIQPWLGDAGLDPDLPMPAMIDVDAREAAVPAIERAVRGVAPAARVDRQSQWLGAMRDLLALLSGLALLLVLLIAGATAAVVLLAARAGLDTHRDTIEVLHMLGSTDVQVARLFQRRIAFDTLWGGAIGAVLAIALAWALQLKLAGLGSEVLGGLALGAGDWILLLLLPLLFTLLATLAARIAVLRTLGKML